MFQDPKQINTPDMMSTAEIACFYSDIQSKYGIGQDIEINYPITTLTFEDNTFYITKIGDSYEVAQVQENEAIGDQKSRSYLGLINWEKAQELNNLFRIGTDSGFLLNDKKVFYYFCQSKDGAVLGAMIRDGKALQFGDGELTACSIITNQEQKVDKKPTVKVDKLGLSIEMEANMYIIVREEGKIHKVHKTNPSH